MSNMVYFGKIQELDRMGQVSKWIGGHDILCFYLDGDIKALSNICPHFGGPVGFHKLKDGNFTCLWHNLRFSATTGECLDAKLRLREYELTIKDDEIWVKIFDEG